MTLKSQPQTSKAVETDLNCHDLVIKFSKVQYRSVVPYWDIGNLFEDGVVKIHNSNVYGFTEFYLERRLKKI